MRFSVIKSLAAAMAALPLASSIVLEPQNPASVKDVASKIAFNMMRYYTGYKPGDTPGYLPDPYYWWEAGAMFGSMIDYWYYTNDTTYNDIVEQALVHQAGEDRNYMPKNASKSLGNDDQGFWGMTAMTAAETNFQNPPPEQPQWLALAQAVVQSQMERWDENSCGGGLKWQIFSFNKGYEYKNAISNGAMFNIASRLAVYTGNQTYADWAIRTWDWMEAIGMIGPLGSPDAGKIFDGSNDLINCTELDHMQWSYNAGIWLHGSANMYRFSNNSELWLERSSRILQATKDMFFWKDTNIMYEQACEPHQMCNIDQQSFKAYLSRWMAATTKLVPDLKPQIMELLTTSAVAAAGQCHDGQYGASCGTKWYEGVNDGTAGVGQQMCALEVVQAMLIDSTPDLVTNMTGGTSVGNYNPVKNRDKEIEDNAIEVTTAGTAGAAILTALLCVGVLGSVWFMVGTDGWVG